ncbi:MAG: AAA family ATPase [Acidobacteriota bacterium]|nr:MAG: AAA family ATPase [Acidobacteriota bacterium]
MKLLPVRHASLLESCSEDDRWLVEGLWAEQAVGLIGGEPKSFKSYAALDLAVAVASGTPCLRHYPVRRTGTVLLYAAEDAPTIVRERLEGICKAAGLDLRDIPVQVITSTRLRLDTDEDRKRLRHTVATLRPVLLVLDPFIRLHRADENQSSEISPMLAYLRDLQRDFAIAVTVVHHAKKGASRERPGQALRGSSEFHGWGDSNLYLQRKGDTLTLSIEHRAAPSSNGIPLRLEDHSGTGLALTVVDHDPEPAPKPTATPSARILDALNTLEAPVPLGELRGLCRMRTQTLCDTLAGLVSEGRVVHEDQGYRLSRD